MNYTNTDLTTMQSWSLERKIRVTQLRIMEWYEHYGGKVYVAFSGGVDSTVLLDLARRIYPEIEAVFINSTFEFPEIVKFVKTFDNTTILKPDMSYKQVVEKYGYPVISKEQANYIHRMQTYKGCKELYQNQIQLKPAEWLRKNFYDIPFSFFKCMFGLNRENGKAFVENGEIPKSKYRISKKWWYLIDAPFKIHDECCRQLKKLPVAKYEKISGNKPILGTMAEESLLRKQTWLKQGCNAFDAKAPKSTPLSFWTHQDILQYLRLTGIPYAEVYGDIIEDENGKLSTSQYQRTGCMGCLFGCHLEREPNRLQLLKQTHPKIYKYLFDKLDYKKVCDYIGIAYE